MEGSYQIHANQSALADAAVNNQQDRKEPEEQLEGYIVKSIKTIKLV